MRSKNSQQTVTKVELNNKEKKLSQREINCEKILLTKKLKSNKFMDGENPNENRDEMKRKEKKRKGKKKAHSVHIL